MLFFSRSECSVPNRALCTRGAGLATLAQGSVATGTTLGQGSSEGQTGRDCRAGGGGRDQQTGDRGPAEMGGPAASPTDKPVAAGNGGGQRHD